MKTTGILLVIIGLLFVFYRFSSNNNQWNQQSTNPSLGKVMQRNTTPSRSSVNIPQITTLVEGLDTPWAIAFLPDKSMLITERPGRIVHMNIEGTLLSTITINRVKEIGEGGLMGIAIHPEFIKNRFIYLVYTYEGNDNKTQNRIVRAKYQNGVLSDEKIIISDIPGAPNHNGGRIHFGPDKQLYITTGDAQEPSLAQNKNNLAGKILRVTDAGKPSKENPFNNQVFSYGHRNSQGITWDANGQLWSTEHGPSGFETGNDELNKIVKGLNYGWPVSRGLEKREGMVQPVIESGQGVAWAPGGIAFLNGKLYFAGLRGQTLYEYDLTTKKLNKHFEKEFGRIREVVVGPDKMLYITTSNRDGRGVPKNGDDKILKINPTLL